jgi:hypothetical protein
MNSTMKQLQKLIATEGPQWLREWIESQMTPADDEPPEEADDFEAAFDCIYSQLCEVAASPKDASYLGGWGPTPECIKNAKRQKKEIRALLKQVGLADYY